MFNNYSHSDQHWIISSEVSGKAFWLDLRKVTGIYSPKHGCLRFTC